MVSCATTRRCTPWRSARLGAFLCFLLFGTAWATDAVKRQTLPGKHVPAAVAQLTPIGTLPGAQRLNLAIGLPLRNEAELDTLLQQLYDPASPNYRRYLTPEEFTARFGPTEADYQALMDFAKANGLTVTYTHPNRLVLDVAGAVADIEKTFNLTLRVYPHPTEARTFYAPDVEPSVDLAVPILHISGLDNYSLPHPNVRVRPAGVAGQGHAQAPVPGPAAPIMGSDFRNGLRPGHHADRRGPERRAVAVRRLLRQRHHRPTKARPGCPMCR